MVESKKQVLVTVSVGQEYKDRFDKVVEVSGVPKSRMVRDMIDAKCIEYDIKE